MPSCSNLLLVSALLLLARAAPAQDTQPAGPRWGHEPYSVASPLDVAVSPQDGTIYVAQTAEGKVVALTPDFKPTGVVIAAPAVTGVDVYADGRVAVVTQMGALIVAEADGREVLRLGDDNASSLGEAWGVTWDPAGNLFVFETNAVRVLTGAGEPLFEFSQYECARKYRLRDRNQDIEETVTDMLNRPCRGDFLPDGRLIVADYYGPVVDPDAGRRAGRYSVWKVDVAAKTAVFEKFMNHGDPYPSSTAGDVCVDRATGRIYTAEADFPLTDHDFVRVQDSVDEPPRAATNFFPYRFLTHPRGIALTRDGDVLVAEADKGLVFALPKSLFATRAGDPSPLDWPKVLRTPVCERSRVVLEYTTLSPALSRVEIAPLPEDGGWYEYPEPPRVAGKRIVEAPAFNLQGRERKPGEPDVFHRVELTDLEPGRRYAYRFLVTDRAYPAPLWSETFVTATQPPEGRTQYLDAEVIVLVFSNLVDPLRDPNMTPDPADPGPMTADELAALQERMEWARRFYWINSRGRFNVRYTYVIDDQRYPRGPTRNYGYWPDDDHRQIDAILARHGVRHADNAGLCVIYGYRHWDDRQKRWLLSGSGGNTWGSNHDGSAINTFSAGGDTAWLFVHEYGHSMGINYQYSGQVFHFNHFHWNYLPTDYGAHYDGMAAICREFSDAAYWANKYGRLIVTDDADNDGLPDDDPRCPLDERRFGSSPGTDDTDDDGLTDLEELLSTMGLAQYAGAFDMRQVGPVFEPGPDNVDTDGDGVLDGDDPYPLYPWEPTVARARVEIDGAIQADEWPATGFVRWLEDEAINGDLRLAWDSGHLFVGLTQKVVAGEDRPARVYMELDANNDGMTVGADNLEMWFEPQPDGQVQVRTRHNDTILRMKPVWRDNILPNPRDVAARWGRHDDEYHLEIGIPQTKEAGLDLTRFEQLGLLFQLTPAPHADAAESGVKPTELRLFEPQQHFDVRLR